MCIYTHTRTRCCNPKPTARVWTSLRELRDPLGRVHRGENQYRGKTNAVFCSPPEMSVSTTFKPAPPTSPRKPNLFPCPPCGCWVSFCSLKQGRSSKAQRQLSGLRPRGTGGIEADCHTRRWKPSRHTEHDHGNTPTALALGEREQRRRQHWRMNGRFIYALPLYTYIHIYIATSTSQHLPFEQQNELCT